MRPLRDTSPYATSIRGTTIRLDVDPARRMRLATFTEFLGSCESADSDAIEDVPCSRRAPPRCSPQPENRPSAAAGSVGSRGPRTGGVPLPLAEKQASIRFPREFAARFQPWG